MNNSSSSIDIPMILEEGSIPLMKSDTMSDQQQVRKIRRSLRIENICDLVYSTSGKF